MHKKSWLIPIIVLLICSLAMIFYQKNFQFNIYATPITKTQVNIASTTSDIVQLHVKWLNHTITVKREGSTWYLTSPTQAIAEGSYIYDIITSFISPGNLHLLAEHVEDPTSYGITEYSMGITFYNDAQEHYELLQGAAINNELYYAYNPLTQSIFAVPKKSFDNISKDLTQWYDKNYLQFDPTATKEVTITLDGTTHTLTPVVLHNQIAFTSTTLPQEQVDILINFLSSSRAQSYVVSDASPQIITSYGFDTGSIHFTISHHDGISKSFAISTSFFEENASYVLLKPSNTILTIPRFSFKDKK